MKIVLVIGGLGSGKSSVVCLLEMHGAHTIDLDWLGHEVLADKETIQLLVNAFGTDILDEKGQIDRAKLGAQVFRDKERLTSLEAITFPRISERLEKRLSAIEQEDPRAIVVIEASSYRGPGGSFAIDPDMIVLVKASYDHRIARAQKAGFTPEEAASRIALQPTDEERMTWADRVIENDHNLDELQKQVVAFARTLGL